MAFGMESDVLGFVFIEKSSCRNLVLGESNGFVL